ncbi:hypothetical protein C8J57DRAFT_1269399 [Mycena rebaudengoi]|nr:hypothetical protein C8J57DRAFT_1269399 [Mycena rebaudengoi]
MSLPPPLALDEYSAADQARTRLRAKTSFRLFRSRKRRTSDRKPAEPDSESPRISTAAAGAPDVYVHLDASFESSYVDDTQDQYRWAILYENQRGLKFFSTLYYSRFSLLPTDPLPFTTPNASSKRRSEQPDVSLSVYPLPDGAWSWLSPWMIDMRSDSGEVQHDGFEYNWIFRTHHWHPEVGATSWVRRRRWVRLMMRPGKPKSAHGTAASSLSPNTPALSAKYRNSVHSSHPPSVFGSPFEDDPHSEVDVDEVWISNDDEVNWERCRSVMRRAGRDGRKLELWRRWLVGEHEEYVSKGKRKQYWTEDDQDAEPTLPEAESTVPSAILRRLPKQQIIPALRKHASCLGDAILNSFIFPESRANFIQLLERAGVITELNAEVGPSPSKEIEFWSYKEEQVEAVLIPEASTP